MDGSWKMPSTPCQISFIETDRDRDFTSVRLMEKMELSFLRSTTLEKFTLIVQLQFRTKETAHPTTLSLPLQSSLIDSAFHQEKGSLLMVRPTHLVITSKSLRLVVMEEF
jgi:hypothetical protein